MYPNALGCFRCLEKVVHGLSLFSRVSIPNLTSQKSETAKYLIQKSRRRCWMHLNEKENRILHEMNEIRFSFLFFDHPGSKVMSHTNQQGCHQGFRKKSGKVGKIIKKSEKSKAPSKNLLRPHSAIIEENVNFSQKQLSR